MMEFEAQAKLLALTLLHGLIDHAKVVTWVDGIIAESNVAEPWMIDISFSQPQDSDNCAFLLESVAGCRKLVRFTEFVAGVTFLYRKKDEPIYKSLHLLVMYQDEFSRTDDELESQRAKTIISELEAHCFDEDYSDIAVREVTPPLEELARRLQEKHPEVIDFLGAFT